MLAEKFTKNVFFILIISLKINYINHSNKRRVEVTSLEKQKVKKKTGTKSLFVERKEFNNEFNVSDANIKTLIKQIQPIYEKIMKDKDYWLKINGDIRTNFNCKWYIKPDIIPKIVSMTRIENKLDPMFECICDNGKKFIAHLRWGYNQGMTNLRLDLK